MADDGTKLKGWLPKAQDFLPYIDTHAPQTRLEMEGVAEGAGVAFEDILLLSCAYEQRFAHTGTDHCTGFAVTGGVTKSGELITGQNNDENIHRWGAGQWDGVVHHVQSSGMETLIYSHAGIPAYMGMNSAGLCVLWMAIDNRERAAGLPTNVLIRELLRFDTLTDAVNYLERVPKTLPNNYLLSQPSQGICNVECSPGFFRAVWHDTRLCHANHILDPEMAVGDVKKSDPDSSTFSRYKAVEDLVDRLAGGIDAMAAQRILSDHTHYPRSICAHPSAECCDAKTLASMVFQPSAGTMFICFGNGCEASFNAYSFESATNK